MLLSCTEKSLSRPDSLLHGPRKCFRRQSSRGQTQAAGEFHFGASRPGSSLHPAGREVITPAENGGRRRRVHAGRCGRNAHGLRRETQWGIGTPAFGHAHGGKVPDDCSTRIGRWGCGRRVGPKSGARRTTLKDGEKDARPKEEARELTRRAWIASKGWPKSKLQKRSHPKVHLILVLAGQVLRPRLLSISSRSRW